MISVHTIWPPNSVYPIQGLNALGHRKFSVEWKDSLCKLINGSGRCKSRAWDRQYPLGWTHTHTRATIRATLIRPMDGRQRLSLLASSSTSIYITNPLADWERAATVQPSDKQTPVGMSHQYRDYKHPLMHSLHLRTNIIYVLFFRLCVAAVATMHNELTGPGDFLSGP